MRIYEKTPQKKLSIRQGRELIERIPDATVSVLIFSAFALTALAPLLVSVKALSYIQPRFFSAGEINRYVISSLYTYDFESLMHKTVFPFVRCLAVAAYVLAFCKNRQKGTAIDRGAFIAPAPVLFVLLAIWVVCNVFLINGITFYTTEGALPNHENLSLYLEYYLCFFMMGLIVREPKWKHRFFLLFISVSLVLVPLAVFLHQKVYTKDAIRCVYSNSNYYGIVLNVVIGLCAAMLAGATRRKWKGFFAAALLVNTAVLYFNNTLGAWVGAFFACLFSVIAFRIRDGKFNRRSLLAIGLFLGGLIACGFVDAAFISGKNNFAKNCISLFRDILNIWTDPDSSSANHAGSGRWAIWKYYLSLVKEHPWSGVGLDGIRALDIGQEIGQKRPHNEYLQYAAFLGIPGVLLYFSACLSVYIRAIRYRRHLDNLTLAALTAAFGYLVGAFFGNTVYNTTPYLYILLGLGYVNKAIPRPE